MGGDFLVNALLRGYARWKHAATCHHGKHIDGDRDFWEDDEVHRKLTAMDACSE